MGLLKYPHHHKFYTYGSYFNVVRGGKHKWKKRKKTLDLSLKTSVFLEIRLKTGRKRNLKAPLREEKRENPEKPKQTPDRANDYPPVNFTNFVLSLSTSALFHFGDFPDSEGGETQKNLPAAKQTIDILDMLNEKTKGNLDKNENNLIQGVLYELKMRYVKENA